MAVQRHTRRVAFLRFLMPCLAVCAVVIVTAWPAINEFKQNQLGRFSLTRAKIEKIAMTAPAAGQPAQLQVTRPQFQGRDEQGRPYRITAERVSQGLKMDMPMTLDQPTATLILDQDKKQEATLRGASGIYDPAHQTLQLERDIVLTHSDGYTIRMRDLFVDLGTGTSMTTTPVSGDGPMGRMAGESLELRDKGNHIILHGKSKVVLTPHPAG